MHSLSKYLTPEEGIRHSGARFTGSCETPELGAGNISQHSAGRGYLCALLVRPVCDGDKHLKDQFKRKMDTWPSLQGFQLDPHPAMDLRWQTEA